jgi:hypothetical protein
VNYHLFHINKKINVLDKLYRFKHKKINIEQIVALFIPGKLFVYRASK